jgi:hypothetical protein
MLVDLVSLQLLMMVLVDFLQKNALLKKKNFEQEGNDYEEECDTNPLEEEWANCLTSGQMHSLTVPGFCAAVRQSMRTIGLLYDSVLSFPILEIPRVFPSTRTTCTAYYSSCTAYNSFPVR